MATPANISVVAPMDLLAGVIFDVKVDGKKISVLVPEGGVQEGQVFNAGVVSAYTGISSNIPREEWRDGLCGCLKFCCAPICCMNWFCPSALLGQVLGRLQLNCAATATPVNTAKYTAITVFTFFFICNIVELLYGVFGTEYNSQHLIEYLYYTWDNIINGVYDWTFKETNTAPKEVQYAVEFVSIMAASYSVGLIYKTRMAMRKQYDIPEKNCQGCEDCCCALWCGCCTIGQMARHSADYEKNGSSCCTSFGLGEGETPDPCV